MSKVSIIIPSRKERYLVRTVEDIFACATGEIEVIAVLQEEWPADWAKIVSRYSPRLLTAYYAKSPGMRASIEAGAAMASGKFLLKTDGHCLFGPSFDEILAANCEKEDIVVPRRFALDAENWKIREDRSPVDYHYLSFPFEKPGHIGMHGKPWKERAKERADITCDDEMSSQGSVWFQHKAYFEKFGGMPEEGYGSFTQEMQQLGLRTWLSGGRLRILKSTFYAHLWKKDRGYSLPSGEQTRGAIFSADYWVNNRMPKPLRRHSFSWLIEKFTPPGWADNWRDCRKALAEAASQVIK